MPKPEAVCIFSAVVRGRRRHAVLRLAKKDQDLDSAELMLMNTRRPYDSFYQGAVAEDYDAPLTDRRLQITRQPKVIQEGDSK